MTDLAGLVERPIRTADIVFHEPSGEEWLVAWADHRTGFMAPCGWPTCDARSEDCRLVQSASDDACEKLALEVAASGRSDGHKALALLRAMQKEER